MTTSKLRICFTADSRYAGGAERYVALLASGLDRDRFDPFILAKQGEGLDGWCAEIVSAGIPVIRVPMNLPFRPSHVIPVLRALSESRAHLVHMNIPGPYDGQMGLLAPLARLAGTPRVVATEHLPRVGRLWKRAMVKGFAYRFVDRVVTICGSNVDPLVSHQRVSPEKIDVVYNGIPSDYGSQRDAIRVAVRNELRLDGPTVGIVFVGSLIDRKGIGTLADALAGLAVESQPDGANNPPWRLFVVGDGEERDRYVRRVTQMGLGDHVVFMGPRSGRDVERLLCGLDLLVVPSFMEGMPYVILEAMACSLPIVASGIDGIPEAIPDGEAGILVEPGDARALGLAMKRFIDSRDLRAAVGRNGRERFKRLFTLDRHVARMEQLYMSLYAGERSAAGETVGADVARAAAVGMSQRLKSDE
jgi:glycosyltransferase involved in cell wall biosynthesis